MRFFLHIFMPCNYKRKTEKSDVSFFPKTVAIFQTSYEKSSHFCMKMCKKDASLDRER